MQGLDRLKDAWQKVKPSQRMVLFLVGGGLTLALLVYALFARQSEDFSPLFSDLQPADAAAVVAALDSRHIPYRLDQQGQTVLVPSQDVYRLRLDLAAEGIPNAGRVGMEIMDRLSLTSTDFDRQVSLLRATQGELERTLSQIQGVRQARVHIVMGKSSPLAGESIPASAAVLLEMQPGQTVSPKQVQGVIRLVAASVSGLQPEQVTVVDQYGQLLSGTGSGPVDLAGADHFLDLQARFERDLQDRLQAFLTQIFGPGQVVTQVAARLNFDRVTTEEDLFTNPDGGQEGLLRQASEYRREVVGQEGQGAAPGDSNFPTAPPFVGGSGNTRTTEENLQHTYEYNRTHTVTQVAPGTVQQLQVAVVVAKPLSPEQQTQLQSLVAAAVGSDPGRRDVVTVTSMPFDRSVLDQFPSEEAPPAAPGIPPLYLYGAGGAALLLLLLLILWMRARARARRRKEAEAQQELLLLQEEMLKNGRPQVMPTEPQVDQDMKRLAREHPELVARTLRAWMMEERSS
ncbi:MAG: flagellar basal-body MS-ring/collar protein FliF [Bacillota bacterium]|nr:flagellar basal-body MS-ring/collar protein FliF [Bacillota bacterium]